VLSKATPKSSRKHANEPVSSPEISAFAPVAARERLAPRDRVRQERASREAASLTALGRETAGRGEVVAATGYFRRVIDMAPDLVDVRVDLGALLYEQGELREAAVELATALTLQPGNPRALTILSMVLRRSGKVGDS
jgi:Flp pilus assembly protein TadD